VARQRRQGDAALQQHRHVVRLQGERALEARQRLVVAAEQREHDSPVVVRDGQAWREGDRAIAARECVVVAPERLLHDEVVRAGFRRSRIDAPRRSISASARDQSPHCIAATPQRCSASNWSGTRASTSR